MHKMGPPELGRRRHQTVLPPSVPPTKNRYKICSSSHFFPFIPFKLTSISILNFHRLIQFFPSIFILFFLFISILPFSILLPFPFIYTSSSFFLFLPFSPFFPSNSQHPLIPHFSSSSMSPSSHLTFILFIPIIPYFHSILILPKIFKISPILSWLTTHPPITHHPTQNPTAHPGTPPQPRMICRVLD